MGTRNAYYGNEGLKINERVPIVQKAETDLSLAVNKVVKEHDLTYLELAQIINQVQANWIMYGIRNERHPENPDKRGGEA